MPVNLLVNFSINILDVWPTKCQKTCEMLIGVAKVQGNVLTCVRPDIQIGWTMLDLHVRGLPSQRPQFVIVFQHLKSETTGYF